MSLWFVLFAMIAAVNPPRVAGALSATSGSDRRRPLVLGATAAAVALVLLAALGSWVLDLLELTDETWRIATGAVAVMSGARHVALDPARAVPPLTGRVHALAPVAYPVVLVPELVLLAVLFGATEGLGTALLGIAVGFGTLVIWGPAEDGAVTRGSARLLAALLIVVGIGLIVAGIRDV